MDSKALATHFRGESITPGAAGYEVSRKVWNSMNDRKPAGIPRWDVPADVTAAVRFAAEQDLYPAVRGGGHNAAGLAMVDDGFSDRSISYESKASLSIRIAARRLRRNIFVIRSSKSLTNAIDLNCKMVCESM